MAQGFSLNYFPHFDKMKFNQNLHERPREATMEKTVWNYERLLIFSIYQLKFSNSRFWADFLSFAFNMT